MDEILAEKTGSRVWNCKSTQHPVADAPQSEMFDIHDSGSDSIRSSKKKKNGPGTTNLRNGRTNNCWQPDYFLIFFSWADGIFF